MTCNYRHILIICLLAVPVMSAREVVETYRGKLLREEVRDTVAKDRFISGSFSGVIDGNLTFVMTNQERRITYYQPIYEKIRVYRQQGDANDPGRRELVDGEVLKGDIEERQRIIDLGPVAHTKFSYLGSSQRTDTSGVLTDTDQAILRQFDDLDFDTLNLEVTSKSGTTILKLTRDQLYEKYGVQFAFKGQTEPKNLSITADWDRTHYQPGSVAKLTVKATNTGKSGDIVLLRGGRSLSRWGWLDGTMFYFGHLPPGEARQFVRLITIPETAKPGYYHLRIGFSERSGRKPQLPLHIRVQ